ncbi:NCS2 family permease [Rarobacter faecitabidus]|uniref:AGZA family xanthine/uracil permease-like MFS transporter n=1 Tax=Rarobacter faecitabidus TaxID=13243 RepID=A0A542ZUK6_RARFA|nr:NCS2 family permease [Rarobacter faecitabidus]TQL64017.1 AGZA family xanthine/uracil permease-like MFS transporter [Rarobacter faecitabidus]
MASKSSSPAKAGPPKGKPSNKSASATSKNFLDRFFKITERGSTIGTEIRGGLVTFFAMSYIIVLNPIILGTAKDGTGAFLGGGAEPNLAKVAATTALVAGVLSILMGVVANFPLALAAGLGLNAVVAFGIANIDGMTWADAMGIVVLEGIIILALVLTGFRTAVFRAVPRTIKTAISVGIGLFIALIGLFDAGFVRIPGSLATPLELGIGGSLGSWPLLVFVIGLLLTFVLMIRKVKGAILISIVVSTVLAIIVQAITKVGGITPDNAAGWKLNVPEAPDAVVATPDFSLVGQFSLFGSIGKIGIVAVILLVFSIMLADFFDTMGTMVAVGAEANLLDEEGNPPKTKQILIVDSIAAAAGGAASVSSNTSYIESSAGVGDGARTGLASVVTGIAFLLATFLAPLVNIVPSEAAAPALVVVGFLMMTQVTDINWKSYEVAVPAFLTLVLMPFTYSITAGIGAGIISWAIIQIVTGKIRKIHPLMWVATLMFVAYFLIGPLRHAAGI